MEMFTSKSFRKTDPQIVAVGNRKGQLGFFAAYAAYAIVILSLIGVAYSKLSTSQSASEAIDRSVDDLEASVIILSQRIEACVTDFPTGDHGQFQSLQAYPAPATANNRADIRLVECPGVSSGTATLDRFGYMPPATKGFSSWDYQHTEADGVRLILVPSVPNGESVVRTRLKRRLDIGYGLLDGPDGELIISLVTP